MFVNCVNIIQWQVQNVKFEGKIWQAVGMELWDGFPGGSNSTAVRAFCGMPACVGVIRLASVSNRKDGGDLAGTGDKIRLWRNRRGYTQEALAERMGGNCTGKQVSYWENGVHEIGLQSFFRIVEVLGVTPNDLSPGRLLESAETRQNPLYPRLEAADRENVDFMISRLYLAEQA